MVGYHSVISLVLVLNGSKSDYSTEVSQVIKQYSYQTLSFIA